MHQNANAYCPEDSSDDWPSDDPPAGGILIDIIAPVIPAEPRETVVVPLRLTPFGDFELPTSLPNKFLGIPELH